MTDEDDYQSSDANKSHISPVRTYGDEKVHPLYRSTSRSTVASRYDVHSIYGDADETTVALERASSRATVASQVAENSLYRQETRITVEGVDEIPAGEEFEKEDPELITWTSPEDPENPRNWASRRKVKITLLASLQTLIPTVASSIISPAVPYILKSYDNHNTIVGSLMVSIMVLIWGFSAIVWAPMSEMIGRKIVLIASGSGNFVFNICSAVAPTTATQLVFRALAGVFNSAPIAMSGGALADIYNDDDRQWPMAIWALAPACGPGIAPILGGWIAERTDWSWVFWVVVILQGITLVALVIFYEETYPMLILKAKKKRLIKETGNENLYTVWDLNKLSLVQELKLVTIRPVLFLTLNPVVTLLATYLAYTYGFMYLILTEFPSLWTKIYHYSPGISGLMYIGYSTGMLLGALFWPLVINWWFRRRQRIGKDKLEDRLFWLPVATLILAAGMFWYGWSAQARLKWPMPCVGIGIFCFGLFCVFQCVQSYIVSLNARLAGSALSACVLGRCLMGGTFPLCGAKLYELGYGNASTIVACLALALGFPWPIMIYVYGPRLRAWADKNIKID